MRKFLLLTYHFPPSNAVAVHRMIGLVRYLPKYGWQPVVIAPPRVPWEPQDPALLALVPSGTPLQQIPFSEGWVGKCASYCAPYSHWILKALGPSQRMIRQHQVEVVLTSSPPHCIHWLGIWLQKRLRLPWIADFRDPWVTNRRDSKRSLLHHRDQWLESKVMQRADLLIANTMLNRQGWESVYPQHASKMVTISNGFDPENFTAVRDSTNHHEHLTILHAGELYLGRDPRPLLHALEQVMTQKGHFPVRLQFLGRSTDQTLDLETEIRKHNLEASVSVEDQVPYATALQRMMQSDILLLLQTPNYRIGVPAKLYEYLGTGRPILALAEDGSDIAWVLRESKILHRVAPTRDVVKIKQALMELMSEVRSGATVVPDPQALLQFTRERMAQRMAECLDSCVHKTTDSIQKSLAPLGSL